MMDRITNSTDFLQKALDATQLRNEAITQNIANVDTPNYKRKKVSFEELLNNMDTGGLIGNRTDERHIPIGDMNTSEVQPVVSEDRTTDNMRLDKNNVDMDAEMALLAKNTIKYNALIERLNGGLSKLKSVIREGR